MYRHLLPRSLLGALLAAASVPAQGALNMVLESRIPLPPCTASDVWAIGDYMLLARMGQGFSVIDIRNPRTPVVRHVKPPGYPVPGFFGVTDIKSDGRFIFVNDHNAGHGVYIYDSQPNPMNPRLVSSLKTIGHGTKVHNMWVDGDYLYAENRIYDVSNKERPRYVTSINGPFSITHDIMVQNGRAYLSNWTDGITIYDVSNPAAPQLLVHHRYLGMVTHNLWPSKDGKYLYSTDESLVAGVGGIVRVWDISNLAAIFEVGQFKAGPPSSVVHSVHVNEDLLFVAYYKEGVRVCDIRNPANPVEIAYYDTYAPLGPGNCEYFTAGTWGVYPWRRDVVLVGDIDSGAYILRLNPIPHGFEAKSNLVRPGGVIDLDFAYRNNAATPLDAFALVSLVAINGQPAFAHFIAEIKPLVPARSVTHNIRIPVPAALSGQFLLDFSSTTGIVSPLMISEQLDLSVGIR